MRNNLYHFRVTRKLTQGKMAAKIGCSRASYTAIEKGIRDGKNEFWLNFQKAFDIPDADMWGLMQKDEN